LYGIRTIRSCREATIEEQGKLSLCYEKNISHATTYRKIIVLGCTERILGGFGKSKFVTVFEKRYLRCFGDKRRFSLAVIITSLIASYFFVV
jgi:hypothetical protein